MGKRKIEQGSIGKRTSLFPSFKNQGMIPLESKLELAYALSLEQNKRVIAYRTQAIEIPNFNKSFLYPDFLIKYKDHTYAVHEVKPSIDHLNSDQLKKLEYLGQIFSYLKIEFNVIDKSVLANDKLVQRILFFYSRGHTQTWPDELIYKALHNLDKYYKTPSEVYRSLYLLNLPSNLGDYLIFHKEISINSLSW
ncbi:TnsA endonuclease N-terminal domain-containing protein [Acinetobacter sp. YH12134]|uniref:TnsA endonuclease N-terminal domain-containing protein n=1 Tax=Acinetobacter sp. YH12134 TaxID=2601118 RepID=UPI0015D1E0E8|nr:TnsA endonuclease N-terminal domain-containing protein [Acinetobacter sp. YH12134]